MTRLVWGAPGERFYETGVDRGVLFVGTDPGVAWNGLVSVTESPTGGEAEPHYFEGYKYDNRANPEQFEATIEAFTYPDAFNKCEGNVSLGAGLIASQQRRAPFSLAYRTKVGNDVSALDRAYKLHLVYNALATPSSKAFSSVNATPSATNFSWKITARPPRVQGVKPSAHFVFDSRKAPDGFLAQIEDILYGTSTTAPRLMALDELFYRALAADTNTYDAKSVTNKQFTTLDGGIYPEAQTITYDGGNANGQ